MVFQAIPHAQTRAVVVAVTTAFRPPLDGGTAASTMFSGYDGGDATDAPGDGIDGNYVDLISTPLSPSGRRACKVLKSARLSSPAISRGFATTPVDGGTATSSMVSGYDGGDAGDTPGDGIDGDYLSTLSGSGRRFTTVTKTGRLVALSR